MSQAPPRTKSCAAVYVDEDDENEQFLDDGKFSSGGRNTIAWLSTEDMMSLQ